MESLDGIDPPRPLSTALSACLVLATALSVSCGSDAASNEVKPSPWRPATSLPIARFEAYAALARGRVHFIGGITGVEGDMRTAHPSRRVDVLDPSSPAAWSAGPDLPEDGPKHHLSVAVWNDAIYVVGGFDGILGQNEPFRPIAVAYVLDAGAATWRKLAPPPLARGGATAQAIDGKIYVTGGAPNEGEPSYAQLDVYDIAADRWSTREPMPTAREHVASCAVDGTMIVVGGWTNVAVPHPANAAAEQYDPKSGTWKKLPPMPTARGGLAALAMGSTCHVVGGEDWRLPAPGTFGSHEVFDTTTGTWTVASPMPTARHGLGLAFTGGVLYAVGGGPSQGNSYTAIVEALVP